MKPGKNRVGENVLEIGDKEDLNNFVKRIGNLMRNQNVVVVLGPPFSGKSTFIKKLFNRDPNVILHQLSEDDIRRFFMNLSGNNDEIKIIETRDYWWDYWSKMYLSPSQGKSKFIYWVKKSVRDLFNLDLLKEDNLLKIKYELKEYHIRQILSNMNRNLNDKKMDLLTKHLKYKSDSEKYICPSQDWLERVVNKDVDDMREAIDDLKNKENEIIKYVSDNIDKNWYKAVALDAVPLFAWIISMALPEIDLLLAISLFPFLGLTKYGGKVNAFFRGNEYNKIKKEFDELPEHRKEALCDALDREYRLKPGTAKKVLGSDEEIRRLVNEIRSLEKEITNIKTQLDRIYSILQEISIKRIEDVLKFRDPRYSEPMLFRSKGPYWIDFEKGYVVEREEVNEIIEHLKNNSVVALVGGPASGKSTIVKHVGYRLSFKEPVYYIDVGLPHQNIDVISTFLKSYYDYLSVEEEFVNSAELKKIIKDGDKYPSIKTEITIIVENAHLDPDYVNELIAKLWDDLNSGKYKMIISSRPISNVIFEKLADNYKNEGRKLSDGCCKLEYVLKNQAITLQNDEILVEKIIDLWNKKKIPKTVRDVMVHTDVFKRNLWLVGYALKSLDKGAGTNVSITWEDINKVYIRYVGNSNNKDALCQIFKGVHLYLKNSIRDNARMENKGTIDNSKLTKICEIFSIISSIYMYEIPVHKEFLLDLIISQKDQKDNIVNPRVILDSFLKDELCVSGEIVCFEGENKRVNYSFSHPAIAELYAKFFEVDMKTVDYLCNINVLVKNGFEMYKISMDKSCNFVMSINLIYWHWLLSSDNTNLEDVLRFFKAHLTHMNYFLRGTEDKLKEKIEKEKDVEKIGVVLADLSWANEEVARKVALEIKDSLISKLKDERDLWKIGVALEYLSWVNEEVAREVALDIENSLISKLKDERDLWKIGVALADLSWANKEVARDVALEIKDSLISKLKDENDVRKIGVLLDYLAEANKEVARDVALEIKDSLISKLKDERDLWKIGKLLWGLAEVNEEVARDVALEIKDSLISKLKDERDLWKIGKLLFGLALANKEVARDVALEIKDSLISKLKDENDVRKIGELLGCLAEENKEVARDVAAQIENSLIPKLKKEMDVKKIGGVLGDLSWANKEVGRKIALGIKDSLISKLKDERDLWKIGMLLDYLAEANKEVARDVALDIENSLISKLKDENDVRKIGMLLDYLAEANKEVARDVANKLLESAEFMKIHKDDKYLIERFKNKYLIERLKRLAKGME